MDVFFSYLLHLAVFFISLSLIFLLYKQKPSASHGDNLPPGNKGWPFVGESLEYLKVGRRGEPEKFINDRVSKYSPDVFQTSLLGERIAVFCGASGNKLLFTSEKKYVTAWWPRSLMKVLFQDSLQLSLKEESTRIRRLLPEILKTEALQHHIPVMDSMAREHLKKDWYPYKQVKIFPLSKKYTFALACRLFLSIKDPNQVTKFADPFALVTSGMMSVPMNFPGTAYNRAIKGSKFILNELLVMIQQRKMEMLEKKETAYADLLNRMLLAKDENGRPLMSEIEIANRIMALLIASHDTISTSITFTLKNLVEHPHVYTKVLNGESISIYSWNFLALISKKKENYFRNNIKKNSDRRKRIKVEKELLTSFSH